MVAVVAGLDLEDPIGDLKDGDVEGAAAEVEDGDQALLVVHAVGESGGRGLVDDSEDVEPCDSAGVLGGLPLGVVEVGRNSDDGLGDGFAQVGLRCLLHLLEDEGADLAGGVLFPVDLHPGVAVGGVDDLVGDHLQLFLRLRVVESPPDQAFGAEQSVGGVCHGLSLCWGAHKALALLIESDNRRCRSCTLCVLDHLRGLH